MIPILFESNATDFTSHGLGDLVEASNCIAHFNNSGEYEMEFEYPETGRLFSKLKLRRIVIAKANHYDENQIFRIYALEKDLSGKVLVKCQHITYDLLDIPSYFFGTTHVGDALYRIKNNAPISIPFNFVINGDTWINTKDDGIHSYSKYSRLDPENIRALLFDGSESILGKINAEVMINNYTLTFAKIGYTWRIYNNYKANPPTIKYSKNMISLSMQEDIGENPTGVFPYWRGNWPLGNKDEHITVGDVHYFDANAERQYIIPLDLSQYFSGDTYSNVRVPNKNEVNTVCDIWMQYAQIEHTDTIQIDLEYIDPDLDLRLCDYVNIEYPELGIDVQAKVTEYTYDVINERCTAIKVGKARSGDLVSELKDQYANFYHRGFYPKDSPYYDYSGS